ncbi:hypothetical protein [Micromonospora sp. NPDC047074]|uniref:hypothetical protein n=1 Tax=Micromonospora sp. NPDC047074 TaxID=3154339 RepID=UPI003402D502
MSYAEIKRSPEQVATDLAQLRSMNWAEVWAGDGNSPTSKDWAESLGWRLASLDPDNNLTIALLSGGSLTLFRHQHSTRFEQALAVAWKLRARQANENRAVVEQALAAWTNYYQAAVRALGSPEHEPRADVVGDTGPSALFKPTGSSRALFELKVNLASSMLDGVRPGSASIRVLIHPA